jgi:hypothetical protein
MPARTVDEVIARLDAIVDQARREPSGAADRAREIERIGALACMFAGPVGSPGPLASSVLLLPRLREARAVERVIDALDGRHTA